jgi:hypothetical protein
MKRSLIKLMCVAALAMPFVLSQSASASPIGGSIFRRFSISANCYQTFSVNCYGGEVTRVIVRGDQDTDLDLYVYDENGNLIASDTDLSDQCMVAFRPYWTGPFTVKIVNRGSVYNNYRISVD